MTRIIYSLLSMLTLVMGVVSYDYWRNPYNIPTDISGNIEEETGPFSPRQIRHNLVCNCDSRNELREFGEFHHPRYLLVKKCSDELCVFFNRCREVEYLFNVSSIRSEDSIEKKYNNEDENFCRNMWVTKTLNISVACVPVQPTIM